MSFYNSLSENLAPVFTLGSLDRRIDISYARIKLGYKYTWEFMPEHEEFYQRCKICHVHRGNKLRPYLTECPLVEAYVLPNCEDLVSQARHFLEVERLIEIINRFIGFA